MRPRTRDEFEIAIVCALPREADAVHAVFDETLDDKNYAKAPGDLNAYTTGKIGQHYVVLAHMPEMGKGSAATAASSLRMSYTGIQLALLVGICGGVPFSKLTAVILGDVIISNSVLQYDFGRQYPDGFRIKGELDTLCRPNREIRSVLSKLETRKSRQILQERLAYHLEQVQEALGNTARYPGATEDRLFEAEYRHKHHRPDAATPCICAQSNAPRDPVCDRATEEDCSKVRCDAALVTRTLWNSAHPKHVVHVGKIASGDSVMKSGVDRDAIAAKHGVIAFEMEGAGVWDTLPCIIIKGVCDYADSHKNKRWQDYAAATAAAGAKAFLEFWDSPTARTPKRHWIIPFQRSNIFVGRDAELEQLERGLFVDERFSKMALYALGGMGKSSVALELVYRMRAKHPEYSVFWVNATTAETLEQSYRQIGEKLGLPVEEKADVMTVVKAHLSDETAGRWFMILDNADDMAAWYTAPRGSRLADHLPISNSGCVLLTTRTRQVATKFAPRGMVGIDEMDFEKSSQLLGNALSEKNLLDEVDKTRQLLEKLCFLPLAIVQAAAYINMNHTTLDNYFSLLTNTEEILVKMLSDDFEDDGRYQDSKNPVASTWLVSFEQIQSQKPLAAEYLAFMSCIDSKAIPCSLLPSPSKKERIEAIGCLTSYSFLYRRVDEKFDMHQLVHLATRNWLLTNGKFEQCLEKATARLTSIFPEPDHEFRGVWRPMLPHVGYALRLNNGWNEKSDNLLDSYACCLLIDGRQNDAQRPFEILVQGRKQAHGAEHPSTLSSMNNLASTYLNQGRWQEAEELFVQVMETSSLVFGPEHPETLTSMNNLALSYLNQSRWQEAKKLILQVIKMRVSMPGGLLPVDLTIMNNLASTYSDQGQWQEAEELLVQVVEKSSRVLGPEHRETLCSMNNLALSYSNRGLWAEAKDLFLQTLETSSQVLGAKHPDTLASMANLASTYRDQGQLVDAEKLIVQVMETSSQVLGTEHPDTLTIMDKLASTYRDKGQLVEAEKLFMQVMETRSQVLGTEHPDTLASVNKLASTYRDQGRLVEAEELFTQVMETSSRVLGAEHPHTLATMAHLTSTIWNQGRLVEAEKLFVQVMETSSRVLGAEHHSTLAIMVNLALTYRDQGRLVEAEKLIVQVMETSSRVFGAEHPDTLTIMDILASTFSNQGRWAEAEELFMQVMETSSRVLGPEHPRTLNSMANLALTFSNQGWWAKAKELEVQVMETRKLVLGADHPDILTSMHNLASTYRNQSRWAEAEELQVQVMETRSRVLGADHPETMVSMVILASTFLDQSRWDDAEKLFVQVMEKSSRVFGPEHPSTLSVRQNLTDLQRSRLAAES